MRKFKILFILISAILCLSLLFTACGKDEADKTEEPQETTSASPASTTSQPSKEPTPTPEQHQLPF